MKLCVLRARPLDVLFNALFIAMLPYRDDEASGSPRLSAPQLLLHTGRLYLDVAIKNPAREPQAYSIFGQGRTDTGGCLGGMNKVPKEGKLDPAKEVLTKIKTRYEGKSVPKEIRVEVFNPQ